MPPKRRPLPGDLPSFGGLVKKRREARQMTQDALQWLTGIGSGGVSRIEGNAQDPMLPTAVPLCQRLGITPTDLIAYLSTGSDPQDARIEQGADTEDLLSAPQFVDGERALTMADVHDFVQFFIDHREEGRGWFADGLNDIATMARQVDIRYVVPTPRIEPDDIIAFLGMSRLYRFELLYPPTIDADSILVSNAPGGVLITPDVLAYCVARHKDARHNRFDTLERLDKSVIERMKLSDITAVDMRLGGDGVVVSMFIRAYQCEEDLAADDTSNGGDPWSTPWTREMAATAQLFIRACRWMQYVHHPDMAWLRKLRAETRQP